MAEEVSAAAASTDAGSIPATTTESAVSQANAAPTETQQTQTATSEPATEQESILDSGEEQKADESIGAPEGDYDFADLTAGDGSEIDQTTATELGKLCKGLNLSQKAFTTLFNEAGKILERRSNEQLTEARTQFIKQARSDSEIGGAKWNETLTLARRAVQQFADQSTKEYLRATGLDCHPGVIKMFRNIALSISGDTVVKGSQPGARRDAAKAFFYNSKMN